MALQRVNVIKYVESILCVCHNLFQVTFTLHYIKIGRLELQIGLCVDYRVTYFWA